MSSGSEFQVGERRDHDEGGGGEVGKETVSFGDHKATVFCWTIGRLSMEGKVTCVLFGQFTKTTSPPTDNWIFIGRNIIQDIKDADNTAALTHEDIPKAKVTSSENDFYESNMEACRKDMVQVETLKTQAIVGRVVKDAAAAAPILRVSGSTIVGVNGRYIEGGYSQGCMRFRNVKGWVIFRQALLEIPELGIYADSCYDAFKGPSTRDLLDRRAGNVRVQNTTIVH